MNIIFLGAPGAGKGTQSGIISQKCNIPAISTGNILRTAMREGTPVGLIAKDYVDHGKLVPDDVIIDIIKERLAEDDCKNGYILDGVPRTIPQAKAMEEAGIKIDTVVALNVPDDVIVERLSGRRTCPKCGASFHIKSNPPKKEGVCDACGEELIIRKDDKPETVKDRLHTYHEMTEPLKSFYEERKILTAIENQPTVEGTTTLVVKALGI